METMINNNIAIITYQFSVVVKSLEKGLIDQNYNVSVLDEDVESIKKAIDETGVFLLYLPDSLFDDPGKIKNLFLICDTIKDRNSSMILIGSDKNCDSFMKVVPSLKDYTWLDRPVNMRKLMAEIEKEAKKVMESKAKKRILIIDDDPVYSQMVRGWLKDEYHMESVEDGMKAIAFLSQNKVDLVLLDYEMPVVDGPKILEMLRMHPDTGSIPVMFLTGVRGQEQIQRVVALKPQGYILKSTSKDGLIKNLDKFFNKEK